MKGFLILIVTSLFASTNAFSQKIEKQVIWVFSMEGKDEKIQIQTDEVHDKIILISPISDTLCINGYRGFETIRNFEGNFILLYFGIRGGSNEEDARTVLVCISNGYLHEALDIYSFENYLYDRTWSNKRIDSLGLFYESGTYKVDFVNLKENTIDGGILTATEYERVESKSQPENNHETFDILHFKFNKKYRIFYNLQDTLDGNYMVGVSSKLRIFKGESYPAIKLKNGEYFFVDGIWYLKGRKNHLFSYNDD